MAFFVLMLFCLHIYISVFAYNIRFNPFGNDVVAVQTIYYSNELHILLLICDEIFLNQMFINSKPVQYNNYCVAIHCINIIRPYISFIGCICLNKQSPWVCKSKSHRHYDNHIVLIDLCVQFIYKQCIDFSPSFICKPGHIYIIIQYPWFTCISTSMAGAKGTIIAEKIIHCFEI